jgi:hypothetical protein
MLVVHCFQIQTWSSSKFGAFNDLKILLNAPRYSQQLALRFDMQIVPIAHCHLNLKLLYVTLPSTSISPGFVGSVIREQIDVVEALGYHANRYCQVGGKAVADFVLQKRYRGW